MPFFHSGKLDNNGQCSTVVVTTTTTTTTTRSDSQAESRKPSLISKLKGNNTKTQVTRETHTEPASTASSRSSGMGHFGRKNKSSAPVTLNNGIGARSNNPIYTSTNRSKPGMGDKLRAKWASSGSETRAKPPAWRNF